METERKEKKKAETIISESDPANRKIRRIVIVGLGSNLLAAQALPIHRIAIITIHRIAIITIHRIAIITIHRIGLGSRLLAAQ